MIWFQGKSILYPDLSYIQLSYKQFVLYIDYILETAWDPLTMGMGMGKFSLKSC